MLGRIMVAVVGIPLLIVILFFSPVIVLTVAFSALCAIAAYELLGATHAVHNRRLVLYAVIFAILVPLWYYFGCRIVGAVGGVFVLMLLLFGEAIASRQTMQVEEMAMTVFAALVVPSMLSVFVLMADLEHARLYMFLPFVSAFTSDAFALFAGMRFGKHKLAPHLSPKKTIEGSVGGFLGAALCCVLYGLVIGKVLGHAPVYWVLALYGLLGSLVSQLGDLSFSYVKRQYGIKDYGHLFREHGGVLDRFDSVTFCAPLTYLLHMIVPFIEYSTL